MSATAATTTAPTQKLSRAEKRRRRRMPWSDAVTDAFPAYAELMMRAIQADARRYRRFGRWHMSWFRIGGFIEIILSVSFPFVITLLQDIDTGANNLVITGISVVIALVSAVRSFYGWNENWQLYKTQTLVLTVIVRRWELALLALTLKPDRDESEAYAATKRAIEDIGLALEHEQNVFFGSIKLPEELAPKKDKPATGQ